MSPPRTPSVISQNTNGPSQYNFSYILIIHAKELFLFLQTNSMIYLDLILIYLDLIARYKVWSDPATQYEITPPVFVSVHIVSDKRLIEASPIEIFADWKVLEFQIFKC